MSAKPSLTLRRRIKAPPAKVFEAWTDPQKIVRWFGPNSGKVVSADTDVRVGGRYRIVFHTEDGEQHDVSGEYSDVVPAQRLSFTWQWRTMPERQSKVTLTFKSEGDDTVLTLLHEQFFDQAARDGHEQGWSGALDKLERLFA